jgi:hypothetical protein
MTRPRRVANNPEETLIAAGTQITWLTMESSAKKHRLLVECERRLLRLAPGCNGRLTGEATHPFGRKMFLR